MITARTRRSALPRPLLAAVVAVLALGACSSSDDAEEEAATTTTEAAAETTTTTTEAPTTTEAASPEAFCALAVDADALTDSFDPSLGAGSTEAFITELVDLVDQGSAVAPPEIADAFETNGDAIRELAGVLEANGYDFLAALEEADSIMTAPEVEAAQDVIDEYEAEVCGIEPDGVGDPEESDESAEPADEDPADDTESAFGDLEFTPETFEQLRATESGRDLMIQGMVESGGIDETQAGCFIDEISPELFALFASGEQPEDAAVIAELFQLFDTCDIDIAQFGG